MSSASISLALEIHFPRSGYSPNMDTKKFGARSCTSFGCFNEQRKHQIIVSRPMLQQHVQEFNMGERHNKASSRPAHVRTLLIDNYDSYTYNIYQQLSMVNGVPPVVVHNDEWTWGYLQQILYKEKAFDNIVISPGPGSPSCPGDIGICLHILHECEDIPILGVCLGHQALGYVHGARIVHAAEPVHGRLSEIEHIGCDLFDGIPSGRRSGFKVVRYHSLVIDADSLPKELIPIAWTASLHTHSYLETHEYDMMSGINGNWTDQILSSHSSPLDLNNMSALYPLSHNSTRRKKILMGIMHVDRPHYGVQFHPESIASNHGRKIFENFKKMTVDYWSRSSRLHERKVSNAQSLSRIHLKYKPSIGDASARCLLDTCKDLNAKQLKLQWKKFEGLANQVGGSRNIFCKLFGDQKANDTFWLDSSSTDQGRARFSFMGGKGGPLWKQLTFRLLDESNLKARNGGYLTIQDRHGSMQTMFLENGFLDFLDKEIESFSYDKEDYKLLPFDFCGGYVGFLGYNLKVECGAASNVHKSVAPDACFFFVDNLVVIDHTNDDVYILSVRNIHHSVETESNGSLNAELWLNETEEMLLGLKSTSTQTFNEKKMQPMPTFCEESFVIDKTRNQYMNDIEKCLKFIRDGESYELCLTTQMRRRFANVDALGLYLKLRENNPAPYAAWLNFANENLSICSSSPERFLRLDGNGTLEAKPIKGTISRGASLEEDERLKLQLQYSEKDQAENLMIVDLLRNDLGRVCEPGTVEVPSLMEVQSYATVHTMVSTIQGKKRSDLSLIDCVRAAFPGGSMTGAPKLRSMELLDSLENCSRGIYSGSIGFFSYNQKFDLNIVIRTIVIHENEASVGAGGAIVTLSNAEDEYEEMMLKARAPTDAVLEYQSELGC